MEEVNWNTVDEYRSLITKEGDTLYDQSLGNFVKIYPEQMATMQLSLSKGDFDTLVSVAHNFKSSSGSLGFLQVSGLFSEIEKHIRIDKQQDEAFLKKNLVVIDENTKHCLEIVRE